MNYRLALLAGLAICAVGAQAQNTPPFNEVTLIDVFVTPLANGQGFTVSLGDDPMVISKHNDVGTITMIEGFYLLSDEHAIAGSGQDFLANGGNWQYVDLPGNHEPFNVMGYSERNPGPGNSIGIHPGESVTFNFTNLSGFTYDFEDYGFRLRYGVQAAAASQYVRAGSGGPAIPGPAAIVPFLLGLGQAARRRLRKS
jgi:hypothetical protein